MAKSQNVPATTLARVSAPFFKAVEDAVVSCGGKLIEKETLEEKGDLKEVSASIIDNILSTSSNEIYLQEIGTIGTNTNDTTKSDSRDKNKSHDQ